MDPPDWKAVDLGEPDARAALASQLGAVDAGRGESSLFHNLAWLLEAEGRGPGNVRAYAIAADTGLRAYAPFVLQPWPMRFRLGEITLFSRVFERLHINAGPIIAASVVPAAQESLVAALFTQLAPELTSRQLIYLEGVPEGGAVARAIASDSTRKRFTVIEPNPRYERRIVRLPGDFDVYLGSLKAQTRQNLRNTERKLDKHTGGTVRLLRFSDQGEIGEFVRRAVAISRKTYQWHLLGLGLRDADALRQSLTAMAQHGWTRCYLLECEGTATAFMIGYLYAGTYYYVDVGFDPDWEKWSVGTVLHMQVLRDLMQGDAKATVFDFSSGSGVHKKRFSNESRMEANYLLIPRGLRNAMLVGAFQVTNAVSAALVGLLEKLHLKAAIKRLVRRHATGNAPPE